MEDFFTKKNIDSEAHFSCSFYLESQHYATPQHQSTPHQTKLKHTQFI